MDVTGGKGEWMGLFRLSKLWYLLNKSHHLVFGSSAMALDPQEEATAPALSEMHQTRDLLCGVRIGLRVTSLLIETAGGERTLIAGWYDQSPILPLLPRSTRRNGWSFQGEGCFRLSETAIATKRHGEVSDRKQTRQTCQGIT
jgi:hypothetical protein